MPVIKRLLIEYDGTDFVGWQYQQTGRSIQACLEDALFKIYDVPFRPLGSGRTDSGVHAYGQVASFIEKGRYLKPFNLMRGLNSILPDDVSVIDVMDVPLEFHPIKSSVAKTYEYKLFIGKTPTALFRNRAWWVKRDFDYNIFKDTLEFFKGEHDFTSFCRQKSLKENPVRNIFALEVFKDDHFISVELTANGFLHTMVRSIVGACVDWAVNGREPSKIKEYFSSNLRDDMGKVAPGHGLYLKRVYYPEEFGGPVFNRTQN